MLPRLHGLPRREAVPLVVQCRDRHRHSCPALVPEDVRAHRRHVRGRAAPAPVGDVAAGEERGPIGEAPRPVETGKVMRSRAICHHQGSWDVRRLHTNLDPLQNLVGDQRTNALSEPYRVDAVGERQHSPSDLLDHGVEIRPALPTYHPQVDLLFRLEEAPRLHIEGGVAAKLGREEEDAVVCREFGRDLDLDNDVARRFPTRELHRRNFVANPLAFRLPHLIGRLPKGVLEGLVLVGSPRP
mmetsp:Transcript_13183/g.36148  ORF Transcript_13183/g.36148 Transcript_13183/m.36148 type:complete len:242 (+) Transcript_13183:1705-2430(+)